MRDSREKGAGIRDQDPPFQTLDLHIVINDTVIDQKPEITLLGVTLDDQLSFLSDISNVCRKASSQTGVLLRLRNLIPTSAN